MITDVMAVIFHWQNTGSVVCTTCVITEQFVCHSIGLTRTHGQCYATDGVVGWGERMARRLGLGTWGFIRNFAHSFVIPNFQPSKTFIAVFIKLSSPANHGWHWTTTRLDKALIVILAVPAMLLTRAEKSSHHHTNLIIHRQKCPKLSAPSWWGLVFPTFPLLHPAWSMANLQDKAIFIALTRGLLTGQ